MHTYIHSIHPLPAVLPLRLHISPVVLLVTHNVHWCQQIILEKTLLHYSWIWEILPSPLTPIGCTPIPDYRVHEQFSEALENMLERKDMKDNYMKPSQHPIVHNLPHDFTATYLLLNTHKKLESIKTFRLLNFDNDRYDCRITPI